MTELYNILKGEKWLIEYPSPNDTMYMESNQPNVMNTIGKTLGYTVIRMSSPYKEPLSSTFIIESDVDLRPLYNDMITLSESLGNIPRVYRGK